MLLPPGAWLMTLMRNRHQQLRSAPAPLSASCARARSRPHGRAGPAAGRHGAHRRPTGPRHAP